jgi:hypothetical protein
MRLILIVVAATFISAAFAQDVPPPPKPKDDGPSLEVTMKFIEEKLNSIGRVNYISYVHDNKDGSEWTNKFSQEVKNVRASVAGCRIDYHQWRMRDEEVTADTDFGFSLKVVLFRLRWKWRERSAVKITERTREKDTEAPHGRREGGHPEAAFAGPGADLEALR